MKEASALYRLLGDEARLRLLRVLEQGPLQRQGADRHSGPCPVRRLAASRPAQGVGPRRRGTRGRLHLLPARPRPSRRSASPLWPLLQSQFEAASATPLVKADEARLQEVLRLRRENFDHMRTRYTRRPATGAGPQLGGVVAGARDAAAGARRGRPRLRRRLLDGRDRALGAGMSSRSIARPTCWRGPRRWPRASTVRNITWQKGELEQLPIDDAIDGRRAAVAGAASRGGAVGARRGSGAHPQAGRPPADPRPARARRNAGCARSSAISGLGSPTTSLPALLKRAGLHRRARAARRAPHQRSVRGAAGDRHETAKTRRIDESRITKNETDKCVRDDYRHLKHCSPNASSCSTARWARWSSGSS